MKKCPNCKTGGKLYQYVLAEQKINGRNVYDYRLIGVGSLDDCICKNCGWKGKTNELVILESED